MKERDRRRGRKGDTRSRRTPLVPQSRRYRALSLSPQAVDVDVAIAPLLPSRRCVGRLKRRMDDIEKGRSATEERDGSVPLPSSHPIAATRVYRLCLRASTVAERSL
ncbi:uncharacterized protein DS421_10g297510 [Arachis hypogaea]|nr:uncharacterized protein DS421_10g297510 [Arachis hypogaea]